MVVLAGFRDPADIGATFGVERRLAAALRGEPGVSGELTGPGRQAAFLDAAIRHRLRPLLAWRLRERGELGAWPAALREALLAAERAEAVVEITRRIELGRLLRAFAREAVPVMLLKGAALAYSCYPEPWLRPREDTDLLVRQQDADRASALLEGAGYAPFRAVRGSLVSHQQSYRRDAGGIRHDVDLHWKAFNPVPFADLLPPEALLDAAGTIAPDGIGPARVPRCDHALLLACLHLAAHHPGSRDDLLWLYDVHLLAGRLTADQERTVLEAARGTGTGQVCARALRRAGDCFGAPHPSPGLLCGLEAPAASSRRGLDVYLQARVRKADLLRAELTAIPTWRGRLRLLRQHLFPPASYMLSGTGPRSRPLLPVLYLRRILRGAAGWFRPL